MGDESTEVSRWPLILPCSGAREPAKFRPLVDIFSLGGILFILSGKPPWGTSRTQDVKEACPAASDEGGAARVFVGGSGCPPETADKVIEGLDAAL